MKLRFVTKKPKHKDYPKELKTLGDHLRKVRLDRGFSQPEVAKILGVVTDTVTCWELNRNTPTAKFAKKILEFIGYIPIDWFDAPTRDHAWWQKKKKRVILYLHPQKGQEVGQVRTRTSQDIGGANVMNTFSKANLKSGEPLVWLSVFRPYDEGEDKTKLASQIKTLVDNEGNASARIGNLRVSISHDGLWQIKR